jgi:hypothetical protein
LARADAATGRLGVAIRRLERVVERLPLPEYVIGLGEAQLAAGRREQARQTFALVGVERRLLARNGVNTDVELALFEADHGSPRPPWRSPGARGPRRRACARPTRWAGR